MICPAYPEKFRKRAMRILKIRYWLLALLFTGVLLFGIGFSGDIGGLMVAGALIGAAGFCFFATLSAKNILISVNIADDGIHVCDNKGIAYRSAEYRYVRGIEIRELLLTEIAHEGNGKYGGPSHGTDAKLIIIYVDGASCFTDLKLADIGKKDKELYWHDELMHHHSCIALAYSDEAWGLLNKRLSELRA